MNARPRVAAIAVLAVAAILVACSQISRATDTAVSTLTADQIGSRTATLHGSLDAMGTGPGRPVVTQGPLVMNNGAASFSQAFSINASDNMLLAQVARGFNCGTISVFTIGGNALSLVPNSTAWVIPTNAGGITGLNWTGVELWYALNPPSGASVTLSVTWTSACDANSAHFIGVSMLMNANGAPIATGTQNTSATAASGTITFNFPGPSSTQYESTVISDGRDGGSGDASLVNQTGMLLNWTACRFGNEHCAAGGLGFSGIVTAQTATTVYYSASSAVINGITNLTAVDTWFQYGDTPGLGNDSAHQNLSSAGPFADAIGGLRPVTTYYFRAMANGTAVVNGSVQTFQTIQYDFDQAVNAFWVLIFVILLTLMVIGAWKLRQHM